MDIKEIRKVFEEFGKEVEQLEAEVKAHRDTLGRIETKLGGLQITVPELTDMPVPPRKRRMRGHNTNKVGMGRKKRRGPGRPKGSKNKPKNPVLTD